MALILSRKYAHVRFQAHPILAPPVLKMCEWENQGKIAPSFHACKLCEQLQGLSLEEPEKCKAPVMWGKMQHLFFEFHILLRTLFQHSTCTKCFLIWLWGEKKSPLLSAMPWCTRCQPSDWIRDNTSMKRSTTVWMDVTRQPHNFSTCFHPQRPVLPS